MWILGMADGKDTCLAGSPIMCGDTVRMIHLLTGKNLHSHGFRSPLTGQQEVSAFGDDGAGDSGDNWKIVCPSGMGKPWKTDKPLYLLHLGTGKVRCARCGFWLQTRAMCPRWWSPSLQCLLSFVCAVPSRMPD